MRQARTVSGIARKATKPNGKWMRAAPIVSVHAKTIHRYGKWMRLERAVTVFVHQTVGTNTKIRMAIFVLESVQ